MSYRAPVRDLAFSLFEGAGAGALAETGGFPDFDAESADAVDWSNVDFDDEPTEAPASGVSIVFAGNRYYSTWTRNLPDFYAMNGSSRPSLLDDPTRTGRLVDVLKRVELATDA